MDGLVCGMMGCETHPKSKCPICNNHYCYEHLKYHLHTQNETVK